MRLGLLRPAPDRAGRPVSIYAFVMVLGFSHAMFVTFGKVGRASIESRVWQSDIESLRRLLQLETDELFIHGGISDVDEFIVQQLQAKYPPMQVIRETLAIDDPDAVEPFTGERGTD